MQMMNCPCKGGKTLSLHKVHGLDQPIAKVKSLHVKYIKMLRHTLHVINLKISTIMKK